jgi:ribosomal protein S18 acetylase RimI-like enzyme
MPTVPNITIRRAVSGDAEALATVARKIFVESFGWENDPDVLREYVDARMTPERLYSEIEDEANRFFLVYSPVTENYDPAPGVNRESEIIAHLKMRFAPDTAPPCVHGGNVAELARFFVRSDWQGRGIAQKMMKFCVHEAKSAGCDSLWLDVFPTNERARRFYYRQGFTDIGETEFPMGHIIKPVIVMSLSL